MKSSYISKLLEETGATRDPVRRNAEVLPNLLEAALILGEPIAGHIFAMDLAGHPNHLSQRELFARMTGMMALLDAAYDAVDVEEDD